MELRDLLCGLNQDVNRLPSIRKGIRSSFRRARDTVSEGFSKFRKENGHGRKHLPEGSGQFTVGCVDIMSDPSVKGVFLRLYYPTNHTNIHTKECNWPLWLPKKQYGQGYAYFRRMNTKVMGKVCNLVGGEVYVPVMWQAPVIEGQTQFPVVVFTHGLGGNRTTYSTLCSDIASHGFIVVAIEHRDGSASFTYCFEDPESNESSNNNHPNQAATNQCPPDNHSDNQSIQEHITQVKEQWRWYERQEREDDYDVRNKQLYVRIEEIERVLEILESMNSGDGAGNVMCPSFDMKMFRGRMDLNKLSIIGHSFGASTAVAALATNSKFKCGAALDAWMKPLDDRMYSGVSQPLLFINTETFQWKANVQSMLRLQVNCDTAPVDRTMITIRGTCHQSHSDFQFLLPGKLGRYLEMRHSLKPKLAMSVNNKATLGFLWKHLEINQDDYHDDILNGEHEHVILGTNLDLTESEAT